MAEYQDNLCVDAPSSQDFDAGDYQDIAMGLTNVKRPEAKVIVRDQGQIGACTRFGLTHVSNGENVLEYERNGAEYTQLNPMDERNKSDKNLFLQAALNQFKTEGLIEGYVSIAKVTEKTKAIQQMKQAIDMGNFLYTGSNNGQRGAIGRKPYIYQIRTDGKIVGHAWSIVAYDDSTQLFKCINSRGPTRGDKGYFYLPYEHVDKIFTKYAIIDKDNSDVFKKFKRTQKAKDLINACSDFWKGEGDLGTQDMLHNLAERLRQEYNITKVN